MSAYLIAICRGVTDRRGLEEYWARARATFEGFDVQLHVGYMPFKQLEGSGPVEGVVMIEFPSTETALSWYESDRYREAMQHRIGAADFDLVLVEGGVVPPAERMPQFT